MFAACGISFQYNRQRDTDLLHPRLPSRSNLVPGFTAIVITEVLFEGWQAEQRTQQ
jgi:hypothetical protein